MIKNKFEQKMPPRTNYQKVEKQGRGRERGAVVELAFKIIITHSLQHRKQFTWYCNFPKSWPKIDWFNEEFRRLLGWEECRTR